MQGFQDADAVARYADGPPRHVPGFHDMHRLVGILLAEQVPDTGRVLVLGAGGGLETQALAATYPGWRFDGVDPSQPMLDLARQRLQGHAPRVSLQLGTVTDAPAGPFDAAVSLLTMHFIAEADRLGTLAALRQRLRPGAPFVCLHHSIPGDAAERALWLGRYAAFAMSSGVPAEHAARAPALMQERLAILSPAQDEALLEKAGFSGVRTFYAAFTFRGWVAYA